MLNKYAKGALVTVAGQLLFLAVATGSELKWALWCAVGFSLGWFLWAAYRLVGLIRVGAHRLACNQWDRESLGFAAGVISATPLLVIILAVVPVVRPPDERTVTAGPKAAFEDALDSYYKEVGSYPTAEQGLQALLTDPGVAGWAGPYVGQNFSRYIHWFEYVTSPGRKPILIPRPRLYRKQARSPTP
jgi:hypothetical protein